MKRRSLLFVPGNNPGMVVNSQVFGADGVIFDLEDAVSQDQKDCARILVRNCLTFFRSWRGERIVRINSLDTPFWRDDVREIVSAGADTIMLPKVQSVQDLVSLDQALSSEEGEADRPLSVIALIETPEGVENARDIGRGPRVGGLLLGAEDLTASLGVQRTKAGSEIAYARGRLVMAAKSSGIDCIDTPFTDIDDMEGLKVDSDLARSLGFDGKAVISPRHLDVVNRSFTPSDREIEWARVVVGALEAGERSGKGVVSVGGKMVDAPVAARAKRILALIGGN